MTDPTPPGPPHDPAGRPQPPGEPSSPPEGAPAPPQAPWSPPGTPVPARPAPGGAPGGRGRPVGPAVQVVDRGPGTGTMLLVSFSAFAAACALLVIGFLSTFVVLGIGALAAAGGGGPNAQVPPLSEALVEEVLFDGAPRRTVAVIPVEGVIEPGRARFVEAAAQRALDDPTVQAVVVRIDSPGGGVTASDHIWRAIGRLRDRGLPVVASFGGVAASGGYYAAAASDHIVAEPTTITGSIGVIAQVMTFGSAMDKLGIEPVTLVASGSPRKNVANDVFRSWTEEDREKLGEILDAAYETFVDRVRTGRQAAITDESALRAVCDGSVYTVETAMDAGLVDAEGYLEDAIAEAERRAGVAAGSSTVVRYALPFDFFGALLGVRERGADPANRLDLRDPAAVRSFVNELGSVRLEYLMLR